MLAIPAPTVGACYGHAWRQLWRHFPRLLLVGFVWVLLNLPPALLSPQDVTPENVGSQCFLLLVTIAYSLLVSNPASLGALYAFLRAVRGSAPSVADIFLPFRQVYVASVLAPLLQGLIVMLGALPGVFLLVLLGVLAGLPGLLGNLLLLIVLVLLVVVPVVFLSVRLAFVPYIVVDERRGAGAAIVSSWDRTAGHGWTILGVGLLGVPIFFVGILLLVVGVIPALLWTYLAYTSLYAAISNRPSEAPAPA